MTRVPLGQRTEEAVLIQFSQRIAPARRDRDVGRDAQDRHRGFVGFHQSRQDVGGAAAARSLADTHLTGNSGVGVGHISRMALIASQDVFDPVIEPVKRVVERQRGIAAKPENVFDVMRLQHPHHRLGACQLISTCGHSTHLSVIERSTRHTRRPSIASRRRAIFICAHYCILTCIQNCMICIAPESSRCHNLCVTAGNCVCSESKAGEKEPRPSASDP